LDPFITLTAAAAAIKRLLLGTGVALEIERDPIITAREVASLDLVSGGRVVFGVGVGWNRAEMENHGTDPRIRGKLMDERIQAMIEMWTTEVQEFHGKYMDFDPNPCKSRTRRSTSEAGGGSSRGSRSSVMPGWQTGFRRTLPQGQLRRQTVKPPLLVRCRH
jgi:alkanesulfonate monooxygenase SsuD/methylene tetrahydromethanopterin reductase-like flavin-dependent oxidoreductase (luciferase family)